MSLGLIGIKCGMTRVVIKEGVLVPVTIIQIMNNRIIKLKTLKNDGYNAVQILYKIKNKRQSPELFTNNIDNINLIPRYQSLEFRVSVICNNFIIGKHISITIFKTLQIVDLIGTSKGKGFSGVIKRFNFKGQRNTHGNSLAHRSPGSIGQCQSPGKVFKGKKMPGHMGNTRITIQNLIIIDIDLKNNALLIKGGIPGFSGRLTIIRGAVKKFKN